MHRTWWAKGAKGRNIWGILKTTSKGQSRKYHLMACTTKKGKKKWNKRDPLCLLQCVRETPTSRSHGSQEMLMSNERVSARSWGPEQNVPEVFKNIFRFCHIIARNSEKKVLHVHATSMFTKLGTKNLSQRIADWRSSNMNEPTWRRKWIRPQCHNEPLVLTLAEKVFSNGTKFCNNKRETWCGPLTLSILSLSRGCFMYSPMIRCAKLPGSHRATRKLVHLIFLAHV